MALIKINIEETRKAAGQFKNASEQSQQMVTTLTTTVHTMESDWAGMTKDQFTNEFKQWETTMRKYVDLLNNIGMQLEQIAARFEDADEGGLSAGVGSQPTRRGGRPLEV
ncbi:MAG TPA: WXG100 family type VII secretion target [Symbiobacteriaceae bacterium]|nr:WXG100 family type VII secretion target [Symbiobacteriaceae bacterium]